MSFITIEGKITRLEMDSEDVLDNLKEIKKFFETESNLTMSYRYEIQSMSSALDYLKESTKILEELLK